jgi:hypothetical protein
MGKFTIMHIHKNSPNCTANVLKDVELSDLPYYWWESRMIHDTDHLANVVISYKSTHDLMTQKFHS